MSTMREIKDVPDSEVNEVIESFKSEGCVAKKIKQSNGKWTVQATCPDK